MRRKLLEPTDCVRGLALLRSLVLQEALPLLERAVTGPPLEAYLLGLVDFDSALALQRRLVYEVSGGQAAAVILCEHPPLVTIGRQGSQAHLDIEDRELELHGWGKRWINRGGGCWLHAPGQLAIYPIIPLQTLRLGLGDYLRRLQETIRAVLADFTVEAQLRPGSPDVWVGRRPVACLGVAVRDWVAYHGAIFNVEPDLVPFRALRTGKDHPPMTSLDKERRGRVRFGMVRQRLLEHLAERLGFGQTVLFTEHPQLRRKAAVHATLAAR